MVVFRTFNDIVLSFLEFLRLVQPDLDTKPGTVSRDLFVDAQAEQLANFYNDLRNISSLQSFFSANGNDLSKLGSNFGVVRLTGSNAGGVTVFTTNSLDVDILIPFNTIVTARNGITFKTLNSAIMRASSSNVYKATATRLRSDLDLASITDEFAIEVSVEATTPGTGGNIGRFSLISQNVPGISNITNLGVILDEENEINSRLLSIPRPAGSTGLRRLPIRSSSSRGSFLTTRSSRLKLHSTRQTSRKPSLISSTSPRTRSTGFSRNSARWTSSTIRPKQRARCSNGFSPAAPT